ncbi:MAG: AAA family ATPase [Gemmatimonadales bacterium]|nr:MAG: AAA family ATPase [Gemmatimonadales bacterium]
MADTVLLTTHRLPLAGALREAFRAEGFAVDLVPSPEHAKGVGDAVLLVLTGERDDDGASWSALADNGLGVPIFTTLPGADGRRRGRELGAVEVFPPDPAPDEVALVGRRTVERRRLQALTGIVGESEPILELLERVVQIAPVDSTVLVTGESGTGKELVARGIHALSPRKHRAFLAVNVAALSDSLLESELFGHEKGAFTGAIDARKGFFELADRGTLFLDEIGEMPLSTQTKLLRVLEQREFLRVGGESPIRVDVRIVAATNRELREAVAGGQFRRDLYYRLNILDLRLPPLRERRGDIALLIRHFVREISARVDRPFPGLSPEALRVLERHDWPGNVRELRNLVESMVVLSPGREIRPDDLPLDVRRPGAFLPVPWRPAGNEPDDSPSVDDASDNRAPGTALTQGGGLRPELEFVFRTLVDLRVDMEELRREFESYRRDRAESPGPRAFPPFRDRGGAIEIGTFTPAGQEGAAPRDAHAPGADDLHPDHDPDPEDTPTPEPPALQFRPGMTMDEIEEEAIRTVLGETGGNRRMAAERLGIGERTLYRKIQKYDLEV